MEKGIYFDYGLLNLGSLILGLTAWILPFIPIAKYDKIANENRVFFTIPSLTACAAALFFQIYYQRHLVEIEDLSAVIDTSRTTFFLSAILLAVTFSLNIINLLIYAVYRKKYSELN